MAQCLFCGSPVTPVTGQAMPRTCMVCGHPLDFTGIPARPATAAVAAARPRPDLVGRIIGGFRVLGEIGEGGMGAVYRAVQLSLQRPVALKLLLPALSGDPQFRRRFEREAQALASLRHPGIVTVFETGSDGEWCWIAMELVQGKSLRARLQEEGGPLPLAETVTVLRRVAEALAYIHGRGIVHRDVKPENVLLDGAGDVRLTDFGLALLREDAGRTRLTGTDVVMGTYDYMSPEQREASRNVDARSDLYALGVLAYELLTGRVPLGRWELPSRAAGAPVGFDALVSRCLETNPERRPVRAEVFLAELGRIPLSGASPRPASPADVPASSPAPATTIAPNSPTRVKPLARAATESGGAAPIAPPLITPEAQRALLWGVASWFCFLATCGWHNWDFPGWWLTLGGMLLAGRAIEQALLAYLAPSAAGGGRERALAGAGLALTFPGALVTREMLDLPPATACALAVGCFAATAWTWHFVRCLLRPAERFPTVLTPRLPALERPAWIALFIIFGGAAAVLGWEGIRSGQARPLRFLLGLAIPALYQILVTARVPSVAAFVLEHDPATGRRRVLHPEFGTVDEFDLPPEAMVDLDAAARDVQVWASPDGRLRARGLQWAPGSSGGVLRLTAAAGRGPASLWLQPSAVLRGRGTGNWDVRLPPDWEGRVDLAGQPAAVVVHAGHGDVRVETSAGDVTVRGASGDLSVRTGAGHILLQGVEPTRFDVGSAKGNIVVEGLGLQSGEHRLLAGEGDVRLSGFAPGASFRYRVVAGAGDVRWDGRERVSGGGSLEGRWGEGIARLDCEIGRGQIDVQSRLPAVVLPGAGATGFARPAPVEALARRVWWELGEHALTLALGMTLAGAINVLAAPRTPFWPWWLAGWLLAFGMHAVLSIRRWWFYRGMLRVPSTYGGGRPGAVVLVLEPRTSWTAIFALTLALLGAIGAVGLCWMAAGAWLGAATLGLPLRTEEARALVPVWSSATLAFACIPLMLSLQARRRVARGGGLLRGRLFASVALLLAGAQCLVGLGLRLSASSLESPPSAGTIAAELVAQGDWEQPAGAAGPIVLVAGQGAIRIVEVPGGTRIHVHVQFHARGPSRAELEDALRHALPTPESNPAHGLRLGSAAPASGAASLREEWTVELPADFAAGLDLTLAGGEILVQGTAGPLRAALGHGRVRIADHAGDVRVQADDGEVEVENGNGTTHLRSHQARVRVAGAGAVNLESDGGFVLLAPAATAQGRWQVVTREADIELGTDVPDAFVDAVSQRGAVSPPDQSEPPGTAWQHGAPDARLQLHLRSESGRIRLR